MEICRDQELQPDYPGFYYPFLNYLAYPSHHCTQLHELTSVPPRTTTTSSAYTKYFSNPNLHPDPNGTFQSAPPAASIPGKLLYKAAGATHTPRPTLSTVLKPPELLEWADQGEPLWHSKPIKQKVKNVIKNNVKSRRIIQRRYKRNQRIAEKIWQIPTTQALKLTKKNCLTNYGFCADPKHNLQTNFNTAIRTHTSTLYSQPANLAYHNLCTQSIIPPGTRQLLGLNLNYCLASRRLPNNINKTLLQLAYSIRTKHYLTSNNVASDAEYIKQLYKKNITWNPPPAPNLVENKITEFEKALKAAQHQLIKINSKKKSSNLTPVQLKTLRALRKNKSIIIKPTDKNLGPALMEIDSYIKQVLREHLLTKDYKQLSFTDMNI